MSVKPAPEVTVNPKFGRRSWVKLWVNEWLDGTTRFEMSDSQRAFWTDLLALAGRSRFPGIICAGAVGNRLVGYPLNRFQSLMSEPIDIEATFALFERSGKIKVEKTQEGALTLYKVELLNWNKYQSEYQRQKKYRGQSDTQGDSQSDNLGYSQGTEKVTRQKEKIEGEVDGEKKKNIQPASLASSEFRIFWEAYPKKIGEQRARDAWRKGGCEGRLGEILASLKDWQKSWSDPQFIPYAHRWLGDGLWKENPYVAARKESLHDRARELERRLEK